jgi:hypothetical protein
MRLPTYSTRQLLRLERIIWRRIHQDLSGGLTFGVDWPTLRMVKPAMAAALRAVQMELRTRSAEDN